MGLMTGKTVVVTGASTGLGKASMATLAREGANIVASARTKDKLEVHHVRPFHLFPNLELDPANLLTLCETGGNCHIMIGHLKNWKSYNLDVRKDAEVLLQKIKARP